MPTFAAPLVGPGLVVNLARPIDLSMRIAFEEPSLPAHEELESAVGDALDALFDPGKAAASGSSPSQSRAFGLPAPTTRAVEVGSFVGDVRRGGSCNCETHIITPHGDGTHTEGVGHILEERVAVLDLVEPGLLPALVVTVAPKRLDSVDDDVVGNHAGTDLVVDELSLAEAWARATNGSATKPRALVVRTARGEERRRQRFSGTNPPYFTVDATTWVTGRGVQHVLVDLPSLDREDDGGLLGAHRAFFDVPPRATRLAGPPPRRTVTELVAVDEDVADGLYALSLQLAPLVADAVPSRPILFPLVSVSTSWLR
jgi:kynurenine formamidase